MTASGRSGAQALLRALAAMGVERIFASPGSDWAPLWEALAGRAADAAPLYVSSRHEETAAAMAVGYAKATGKLPALVLHTTVGALHATMILRSALHERTPLVVLAGESVGFSEPPAPALGRQWLRLLADVGGPARLVEPCVKWSFGLNSGQLLPHTAMRACQLAWSAPKGPVFVSVPGEFLMETMSAEPPAVAALPRAPSADPAALDEVARALCDARNPAIVTEEAGKDPAAVEALVALAEALGAPVLEAWAPFYVNFPRSHPLYAGVLADEMHQALRDADAVLLVESVQPWYPPSSISGKKILVLGEDPLQPALPYWGFRADVVVSGAVGPSLRALAERVRARQAPRPSERWRERHEAERLARRREAQALGDKSPIDTRWVARELNEVLPEGAIVVNETITHRLALQRLLEKLRPGDYFQADYGGLGVGLGLALGVKHARPDRTVICTIGDGAFSYNPVLASFGAAQEHQLPILVVLFDNSGYLSQKLDVVTHYPQGAAVRTGRFVGTSIAPAPDYAALARAFGGTGERVESPRQVRAALMRGLEAVANGQLALIDVVLAPVNPS